VLVEMGAKGSGVEPGRRVVDAAAPRRRCETGSPLGPDSQHARRTRDDVAELKGKIGRTAHEVGSMEVCARFVVRRADEALLSKVDRP
jgi:hypothetical protein